MAHEAASRDYREKQILWSAIEAFGAYGIRGASLRDIARDADVSLTLISHHFGNKPSLVAAAAEALRTTCASPLKRLRDRLEWAASMQTEELVSAWMDYFEEAFGSASKLPYLLLMQRLRSDPTIEPALRASLDVSEHIIRRALHAAFPKASTAAIDSVLRSSRSVLLTAFLGEGASSTAPTGHASDDTFDRTLLATYLCAGIEATLRT